MIDRQKPKRPIPRVTACRMSELPSTYIETSEHNKYADDVDAYYGDLLRRAVGALDKSVAMAGVYDFEVDAIIDEIREHLREDT